MALYKTLGAAGNMQHDSLAVVTVPCYTWADGTVQFCTWVAGTVQHYSLAVFTA